MKTKRLPDGRILVVGTHPGGSSVPAVRAADGTWYTWQWLDPPGMEIRRAGLAEAHPDEARELEASL